ncbi:carboxylate--amine ligase [Bradyrhizobium sp. DASA03120]|uniref:carboxylate--amine ligase n=1 Tax=Bradyrhizobium sp. SMVTL-02 TaxID=3395917 RepID=UPI003F6F6E9D
MRKNIPGRQFLPPLPPHATEPLPEQMAWANEGSSPFPVLVLKTGHYALSHGGLGIIRSLGMLGAPVFSIVEDRLAPTALCRYLTGTFVWDTGDLPRPQLLEGLAKIGRQLKLPTVLIPTDDGGAMLIAEEALTLQRWFLFPKLRSDLPRNLVDKSHLHTLCKQLGVPCPQAISPVTISEVHEFIETAAFPVVVKPSKPWLNPKIKPSIVSSPHALLDLYRRSEAQLPANLLIQEYIRDGEDWLFNGYSDANSKCLAGFTGRKLRCYPPRLGTATLCRSVTNQALLEQAEALVKAVSYAGIMDIDYRFDKRDGQYKLLDFNPRIGTQFRSFEDSESIDVARALYRDLTGQSVRRSPQIDGRVLVVEPYDFLSSIHDVLRRELSVTDWWRSFKGAREFAWFRRSDPRPFIVIWIRLAIACGGKAVRFLHFLFRRSEAEGRITRRAPLG